jgi:hypothetical protein
MEPFDVIFDLVGNKITRHWAWYGHISSSPHDSMEFSMNVTTSNGKIENNVSN